MRDTLEDTTFELPVRSDEPECPAELLEKATNSPELLTEEERGLLEEWEYAYEDWYQEHDYIIRAKWTFDGAKTLEEAALMLEGYAAWVRSLDEFGWYLRQPIDSDYGFVLPPDGYTCDQAFDKMKLGDKADV